MMSELRDLMFWVHMEAAAVVLTASIVLAIGIVGAIEAVDLYRRRRFRLNYRKIEKQHAYVFAGYLALAFLVWIVFGNPL
jgi:membrane protein YdbS with pleckstrin-like domain